MLPGPTLVLHGPLAGADVEVSLTHERGMAGAVAVVPLQLLAYRIARLRGMNVDQPRNLAKTVTVE